MAVVIPQVITEDRAAAQSVASGNTKLPVATDAAAALSSVIT